MSAVSRPLLIPTAIGIGDRDFEIPTQPYPHSLLLDERRDIRSSPSATCCREAR